jgi:uncharacterized protein (DUF488 family)
LTPHLSSIAARTLQAYLQICIDRIRHVMVLGLLWRQLHRRHPADVVEQHNLRVHADDQSAVLSDQTWTHTARDQWEGGA